MDLSNVYYWYGQMYNELASAGVMIDEKTEAVLFAKAYQLSALRNPASARFCSDAEIFVSNSPTGYNVSGYVDSDMGRTPFSHVVKKENGYWVPSVRHVAPDTKTGSNFIKTWVLLMAVCFGVGILMTILLSLIFM
jgi:hypothetical protein